MDFRIRLKQRRGSQETDGNPTARRAASGRVEAHESTGKGIVTAGLAVGGVLGFSGSFLGPGEVQDVLYAVSAVGLILAATLLAVEHASTGRRLAAAGFALLALGETRLLSPTDAPGADVSFAAGVMLYAPGLLLIGLSSWAPRWARATGVAAAVFFAAHALAYFGGRTVDSTGPLASIGYGLLTVTVAGWVITVLRSSGLWSARLSDQHRQETEDRLSERAQPLRERTEGRDQSRSRRGQ
ncbi:hypothetical protein [Kribbella swartbergensis]